MRLILASASPRRAELLTSAPAFTFVVMPADVDETPLPAKRPPTTCSASRATKARAVASVPGGRRRHRPRGRHRRSSPAAGSWASRAMREDAAGMLGHSSGSVASGADGVVVRRPNARTRRARHDPGALPAAEPRPRSRGTSRPASRTARPAPTRFRAMRPVSSTGSMGPGRTWSGCRSRLSTGC